MSDQRGLTLPELTIVLFILGLTLALVPLNFAIGSGLPTAVRHLIGMMRALSLAASTDKETYRLNFNIEQGTYWATVSAPAGDLALTNHAVRGPFRLPDHVIFQQVSVSDNTNAVLSQSFIDFYPIGNADHAVIQLTDGREHTVLYLDPITAEARVMPEGEPSRTVLPLPQHLTPLFTSQVFASNKRPQ